MAVSYGRQSRQRQQQQPRQPQPMQPDPPSSRGTAPLPRAMQDSPGSQIMSPPAVGPMLGPLQQVSLDDIVGRRRSQLEGRREQAAPQFGGPQAPETGDQPDMMQIVEMLTGLEGEEGENFRNTLRDGLRKRNRMSRIPEEGEGITSPVGTSIR